MTIKKMTSSEALEQLVGDRELVDIIKKDLELLEKIKTITYGNSLYRLAMIINEIAKAEEE